MKVKYVHTNLIAKDWKTLSDFYVKVFDCQYKYPERNLSGEWLDKLTSIKDSGIRGIHLIVPGYGKDGPTIEIFQYNKNIENKNKEINTEGFGHIAFLVDDVEVYLKKVIENGGSSVGDCVNGYVEGVGKINLVYAKDPEGNIIEIQKWE